MMSMTKAEGKKQVVLECEADPGCKVFVAGSFNNWNPKQKAMKPTGGNGHYKAKLMLSPGEYQYKFVVDGDWRIDSNNPHWTLNDVGSMNSVIEVG